MPLKSLNMLLVCLALILAACGETTAGNSDLPSVVEPPAPSAENGQAILDNAAACDEEKPSTCVGSEMPSFVLEDFQPNSEGFGESYGLDRFQGKVTYVSLWASWCGYCRSQATNMAAIHEALIELGVDVNVVAINVTTGVETQSLLADTCSFPLLQDTTEIDAWSLLNGGKDDMYIYDAEGKLLVHLPAQGDVETTLSTPQGFANVRDVLLAAAPPATEEPTNTDDDSTETN